jgi:hypothetical protein
MRLYASNDEGRRTLEDLIHTTLSGSCINGVRLNIRPVIIARTFNSKSILRVAPKSTKLDKDGGKEPTPLKEDYRWLFSWDGHTQDFAGGTAFDGTRLNAQRDTRADAEAAGQRARGTSS